MGVGVVGTTTVWMLSGDMLEPAGGLEPSTC